MGDVKRAIVCNGKVTNTAARLKELGRGAMVTLSIKAVT
jgi:hypothetical protein